MSELQETPGLLDRLYSKLSTQMKWDEDTTLWWFVTSNPHLGGVAPFKLILCGRGEKLEKFIDAMIDLNTREEKP